MLSSIQTLGTCFHFVRHGVHAEFGELLSGRSGAAPLTDVGREQAARVAGWAGRNRIAAIYSSPRTRTLETATIIASAHDLDVTSIDALDEVDFGKWNGRSFAELKDDPLWRRWNSSRSIAPTPGGETMAEAVARTLAHVEIAAKSHGGGDVLCVTHCDIIRGTLAHFLGLSLDNILRFDIDPGSVSTIELGEHGPRVTRINEVPA